MDTILVAYLAVAALLGASIGSFLTLITYRLPLDQPVGMTRSRCPSCLNTLRMGDLIPILSWCFSCGRCRQCNAKVSMRYPLTELACAFVAVGAFLYYGLSWEAVAVAGLGWSIVAIILTDLEHTIILDEVQIAVAVFGALYGLANSVPMEDMLTGALTGAAIGLALKYGFLYFRNKDGLGMGDVKFLAAAGVWLADAASFIPFLFFSGLLGIVSGLLWRMLGRGERFPFGPSLAAALVLCILYPPAANGFWTLYGLLQH